MTIVVLNGIRMEVNPPDIDQDGQTGGIEQVTQRIAQAGTTDIIQPTELGEAMKELDDDTVDPNTRMSRIDMRSRLHPMEISSILAMDTLVALKVIPSSCLAFTLQKKRLNVSLMGQGRKEKVEMAVGKREQDAKTGMMGGMIDKAKGFFGGKSG